MLVNGFQRVLNGFKGKGGLRTANVCELKRSYVVFSHGYDDETREPLHKDYFARRDECQFEVHQTVCFGHFCYDRCKVRASASTPHHCVVHVECHPLLGRKSFCLSELLLRLC